MPEQDEIGSKLKTRLLTLSLEIDDRIRASDILRGAIESEHVKFDESSDEIEKQYATRLEKYKKGQSAVLTKTVAEFAKLLEEKQDLSASCRQLLEDVRLQEEDTKRLLYEVKQHDEQELQAAQSIWVEGEVSRRERWIAKKTEDIRERTVKGLEPEIQRLVEQHKVDCLEIDTQVKEEERILRKQIGGGAEASRDAAQHRARRRLDQAQQAEKEQFADKVNKLVENHHSQLEKVQTRLSSEKEAHRKSQIEEMQRQEEDHADDMAKLQAAHQDRLKALREKLRQERENLRRYHQDAVSSQECQGRLDQQEWEMHMHQKVMDDQEVYLEKERLRLGRMRDAEIEKTIHVLQTENLVFEKKCSKNFDERMIKAKVELEDAKMMVQRDMDGAAQEYERRISRQGHAVEGEAMAKGAMQERASVLTQIENEIKRLKQQVEDQNGLFREEFEMMGKREEKIVEDGQRRREEMLAMMAKTKLELKKIEDEKERRRKDIDMDHENILQGLHLEVKRKVEDVDADVARLRDAMTSERAKRDQLEKILEKYDENIVT